MGLKEEIELNLKIVKKMIEVEETKEKPFVIYLSYLRGMRDALLGLNCQ